MRTAILRVLAGIAALALPASVFAAEPVLDMKGDWVGQSYTIIAGSGGHWPASAGTFDKPGLYQRDLVIRVTNQIDRRFWGVTVLPGSDPKSAEPFIGELTGKDNHFAVFVDTDGYFSGEISGDTLSFCYTQAGGGPDNKTPAVISCTDVRHQH